MEDQDILLKAGNGLFSLRVAGVLEHNGKILVHRFANGREFSFPGGHVQFGETSEQALIREYREEIKAQIKPGRLLWIQENFWKLDGRDCHQIAFYYQIKLEGEPPCPLDGSFYATDTMMGKTYPLEFVWLDLSDLKNVTLYPEFAAERLLNPADHTEHFLTVSPAFTFPKTGE